ncbi:DUF294 nucleotidyltransferase-like domain-containing protein [Paracoccus sp. p4-l81]|uniref:DUF294 nucleotidyltransferase-like domain-containing protein n=1 Tax=Paracoccus sp. p4-l81 TaxID=3342806 RepID=UPI0035B9C162
MPDLADLTGFLGSVHPYDNLPQDELARVASSFSRRDLPAGEVIYQHGEPLAGLFLIRTGGVEITDRNGATVSLLGPRNSFGERGLMKDGIAVTTARTAEATTLLMLPGAEFRRLMQDQPPFRRFFTRGRTAIDTRPAQIDTMRVADLLARNPLACPPDTPAAEAARMMRDAHVSSLGVTDAGGALLGIVTVRDMSNRVLAAGLDPLIAVAQVMTADPLTLAPTDLGTDVLQAMMERRVGHLPVVEGGRFVGMITQTDLTRLQATSSAVLLRDVMRAETVAQLAAATATIPQLLVQLVASHHSHDVVTRMITDITDAVTRRLLVLAEARLGPPPVPYLWLACGSQGRQEQTGVSDQDNVLILDDAFTEGMRPWFADLARSVSDGLNACGYVYCPGEMMATNPRWCQPVATWRRYFHDWTNTHQPESQMLASVMFDLRPIGGTARLFQDLQAQTLEMAASNSIFVAHLIANSLKHTPPLGLLRGLATIRSGEHRNHIDMKMNGVVPVIDLARVHALRGRVAAVNTRARLIAAEDAGVISTSGARDLIDAYDLIAGMRLQNQADLIRAGRKPDNYLAPSDLSDLERSHLRDAFVVIRTMQTAIGHGKGALM